MLIPRKPKEREYFSRLKKEHGGWAGGAKEKRQRGRTSIDAINQATGKMETRKDEKKHGA